MKIMAGGFGTRLAEETGSRPKHMVEIGGKPMLWQIMNLYAQHGYRDSLIACGCKGEVIKEYFRNFLAHNIDLFLRLCDGSRQVTTSRAPDWSLGNVDTGRTTLTGGRLRGLKDLIGDQMFMMTYGDGLADIDIQRPLRFHRAPQKLVTVTAVSPVARFGSLLLVFGIHEVPQRLIPYLIRRLRNDTPVDLTPVEQVWDLLFEDDVVNALLQASESDGYNRTRFRMFVPRARFASESGRSCGGRVEQTARTVALGRAPLSGDDEPLWVVGDNRQFVEATGWRPQVSLVAGLRRMLARKGISPEKGEHQHAI
jgi:hypothetical protein